MPADLRATCSVFARRLNLLKYCMLVFLRKTVAIEVSGTANTGGTLCDKAVIQFPVMHAPFHNCNPYAGSRKKTRQLTLDFKNEGDRPDIQQFRTLIENVNTRIQHLCLSEEKELLVKNFPTPPTGTPPSSACGSSRSSSPGHKRGYFPFSPDANHGFPLDRPTLKRQNAEVYRPSEVPPIIKNSGTEAWPDKIMLKFEPDTVSL